MFKDGITTSGYGAENTRKIRGVGYIQPGLLALLCRTNNDSFTVAL